MSSRHRCRCLGMSPDPGPPCTVLFTLPAVSPSDRSPPQPFPDAAPHCHHTPALLGLNHETHPSLVSASHSAASASTLKPFTPSFLPRTALHPTAPYLAAQPLRHGVGGGALAGLADRGCSSQAGSAGHAVQGGVFECGWSCRVALRFQAEDGEWNCLATFACVLWCNYQAPK